MGFTDRLKTIVTGKSADERAYEKKRLSKIRKEVNEATLEARRVQAIRLAKESTRIKTDKKIALLKSSPRNTSSPFNYGSMFGEPRKISKKTRKPLKFDIFTGKYYS